MVSKNNQWQHLQASAQHVPHYGLRKLSVGVASVLLSTTLYMGVSAHADTVTTPSETVTPAAAVSTSGSSGTEMTGDATGSSVSGLPARLANSVSEVPTSQGAPANPVTTLENLVGSAVDAKAVSEVPAKPVTPNASDNKQVDLASTGDRVKPDSSSGAPMLARFMSNNQANDAKTTESATMTWTIHYVDENGTKLAPDTVISHDYQRTDTVTTMGDYKYVDGSLKVTGTNNTGYHIDVPDFKYNQTLNGKLFDMATWQVAALKFDGYHADHDSLAVSDYLTKDPGSLGSTSHDYSGGEFTFHYTLNPKTVTINYVNDDDNEKVVGTGMVSGKPNTAVTITPNLPSGYMLTPGKAVPSTYTVTDGDNQAVTIHVQKQLVDVSATDPQAKQTRTITLHYVYAGGLKDGQPAFDDAVLDVYYHRTATLDRATNQTTYGDWKWDQSQGDTATPGYHVVSGKWTNLPQSWATVTADVPSVKGYYADLGQNDPTNTNHVLANTWVFPTYNNGAVTGQGATAYLAGHGYEVGPTHTIKYVPNQTTITVNYVDDDNNGVNVGHQSWNGMTGQHIDLILTPPENYVLTPGWINPTSYDFDGVNSTWYTVHVKHKTQDVTDQEPKDQVTKVTRLTRNHLFGDGPHKGEKFAEPDIFDLAWKRTATKDLVTDKVTFGDWQVDRDNSKNVQGSLWIYSDNSVGGSLRAGYNGYSYLGRNTHQEFSLTDGSTMPNTTYNYGWWPDQALKYPILNIYYGPEQVKIPIYYVDADTDQQLAWKVNDDALTGNDFRDGNTVTLDQSKLTSLPTTLTGYQLLPGQTLPTSYKIDTFAGVKAIEVQVVKDRSVKVSFVDDQFFDWHRPYYKKQVGQTVTVTGRDGDTVDLKLTVPDKYQLADGQQLPTTYTFTKGSGDITIHLKHQVVQRKATIDVQLVTIPLVRITDNSYGNAEVVPQTEWTPQLDDKLKNHESDDVNNAIVGTLTGHVNYDLVNGKVVSFGDDWTTLNLDGQAYQLPNGTDVVNGFVFDYDSGKSKKLREGVLSANSNADPDYVNRPWHGYLSVNATNNLDYPVIDQIRQAGMQFKLVGDEPNVLAKANGDHAATAFKMTNINISFFQNQGIGRDFNEQNGQLHAKAFLPAVGVYIPYVEKTATRTINVTMPDGKTTTVEQIATLAKRVVFSGHDDTHQSQEMATIAMLTKEVIHSHDNDDHSNDNVHQNWTTGEWASYDAPIIPGYTPSQANVVKETVTGTTEDQTINITYTANPQTTHVNYVDAQGKLIHTTTVNGVTAETVKVPSEVPDGWKLVDGQVVPSEITFGTRSVDINYLITHRVAFVKSTDNVKAGDLIPGTQTKTFNDKVNADNLVTHASYTVNIWADEAHTRKLATKTYHTDFIRNAVFDAVTGDVYYYNWSEGGKHVFAGFIRPAGNGYQAVTVPVWTATQADPTKTVDLVAQPQQVSGTIQYQTMDGKVVATQAFTSNNAVALTAPKGYTLMTDETAVTPTSDKNQTYVVYVRPAETLYTAADKLPAGVESLRKTITRTIHITEANGHVRTIAQRVHFTRTATVKADGSVVYSNWQATGRAVWNKVFLPKRHGYHAVIDGQMDKMNVTGTMGDVMVNVQYVKD